MAGMIRGLDELGRVCIPSEIRKTMSLERGDSVEIQCDGEWVKMRRHNRGCIICDSTLNLVDYGDVKVCRDCIRDLAKL